MLKNAVITAILAGIIALSLAGCSSNDEGKLNVVTSTSLITSIVERVGGDAVTVTNIIPPAQCPGHFDVKPADVQKLADADLFILHGWQGEKFSSDLIASVNNPDLEVVPVGVQGNWLVPQVQLEAARTIAAALRQADPANAATYEDGQAEYEASIQAKEAELNARIDDANIAGRGTISSVQLEGFLNWVGLNVAATYGEPDSLTPQVVKQLVDSGTEAQVKLVIDNLQSGQDAGAGLAEELGAKRIVLTNFPGGFAGTETWEKTVDKDVDLILEALR